MHVLLGCYTLPCKGPVTQHSIHVWILFYTQGTRLFVFNIHLTVEINVYIYVWKSHSRPEYVSTNIRADNSSSIGKVCVLTRQQENQRPREETSWMMFMRLQWWHLVVQLYKYSCCKMIVTPGWWWMIMTDDGCWYTCVCVCISAESSLTNWRRADHYIIIVNKLLEVGWGKPFLQTMCDGLQEMCMAWDVIKLTLW